MKCPSCGHPEMVTRTCDEILSYGGKSVTLHDMRGDFCPECGEGVWDTTSYHRYTEEQAKLVNVGGEIRSIRKKFRMTQVQMAQVFGLGKMAFSRYERGQSRPTPAFVKLLRVMDRHPDLMAEIRDSSPIGQVTRRTVCPATNPVTGSPNMGPSLSLKKRR